MKYNFQSDYCEFMHPKLLEAFNKAQGTQFEGYGLDEFSERAVRLVRDLIKKPDAAVHFIAGGTHANLVVISSVLRPHEAVIAADTGHIFVHETGSIEATGHKICTRPGENGKITVSDVESVVKEHCDEHMVKPRLVYISQSTECGTIYSKAELTKLSKCCKKHGLFLFMDGARLGAAVNSPASDLSYSDIADLVDAFYIGGTKNGFLFGEAIVLCNERFNEDFRFLIKQRGAMLAKGAALGVQFEAMLSDGLYDVLAKHSVTMAMKLADGIRAAGFDFVYAPVTNMIIPIFPKALVKKLRKSYGFHDWQDMGDLLAVRLVTSWAAPERFVDEFLEDLRKWM